MTTSDVADTESSEYAARWKRDVDGIDVAALAAELVAYADRFGIVAEIHNGVYGNRHCEALAREVIRLRGEAIAHRDLKPQNAPCVKCGYDPAAVVVAAYSFMIERDPPSLNARVSNTIISNHKYKRERDMWCLELRRMRLLFKVPYAIARESNWPAIAGQRRVTITREYGGKQRERDKDNLAGGMKPLIDAMVIENLLADDAPAHAEIHYQQRKIDKAQRAGLLFQIEILAPETT